MTEPSLINDLVERLTPARPLRSSALWLGVVIAIVLAAVYIFLVYGPRPEIAALVRGDMTGGHMMWLKPLLFLGTGSGALWAVTDLARPQGQLRIRTLTPVAIAALILLVMLVRDVMRFGPEETLSHAGDPATLCVLTIVCGGIAGLVVLWRLWLRRAATSHPAVLGAMSGLAAASFMASAYAVHCNMDTPVYILVLYGLPVAVVTGLAAVIGSRLLRW